MTTARLTDTDRYCVFCLADALFALPATCLLEVAANPGVSRVPGADSILAGVCHLRNEFLAVIDLRTLAGEDRVDFGGQQLLVISGSNGPWAALVDRVLGLESLDVSISQDRHSSDDWTAAMLGSATLRNRAIRILEPGRVFRLADQIVRSSWMEVDDGKHREMVGGYRHPASVADMLKEDHS